MQIGFCVPTLNAGPQWGAWLAATKRALPANARTLVIDSASDDNTAIVAEQYGFEVMRIRRVDFNHGLTRQRAVEHFADSEVIVFMTQDAILASDDSIKALVDSFDNPEIGAAYGRQLPHIDAGHLGAHARIFNYPAQSALRSQSDIPALGIKTAFFSNSFAAYRRSALVDIGGFPGNVILGEDTVAVARMVLAGWKIAYQASAAVHHSHDYGLREEFRRYFDIGVLHAREPWLLKRFGRPTGEGKRFVLSELHYLTRNAPWLIPSACLRSSAKYAGYKLGLNEGKLTASMKCSLSMHKGFWKR